MIVQMVLIFGFAAKGKPLKGRAPCSLNYNTSCARLCLEWQNGAFNILCRFSVCISQHAQPLLILKVSFAALSYHKWDGDSPAFVVTRTIWAHPLLVRKQPGRRNPTKRVTKTEHVSVRH